MARAAVKAKQQARAKAAQPTKPARGRGRRRHSGGGNPNQQLFFMRLRRGQRWVYAALAVIFALTFVGVGVGSGTGGLSQLYSGLFGAGGNAVSKAKDEVKSNPAKGYRDLATAYETKGDAPGAISALQSYLGKRKTDAGAWTELGGLETSQAQVYTNQYQAVQQSAQLADPSAPFLPGGTLAQAVGTNAAYQGASQQAQSQTSALYQQAIGALNAAVSDYQHVTKLQPHSSAAQQQVAQAAENAGNLKVAIGAWRRYLELAPNSPQKGQIEKRIKQLAKSQAAVSSAGSGASAGSSNGGR
jgi:tetratricopeptide (TPR) repeat protein